MNKTFKAQKERKKLFISNEREEQWLQLLNRVLDDELRKNLNDFIFIKVLKNDEAYCIKTLLDEHRLAK